MEVVSTLVSFANAKFLFPLSLLLISSLVFLLTLTTLYRRYNRWRTAWTCVHRNTSGSGSSASGLLTGTDTSAETEPEDAEVDQINSITFGLQDSLLNLNIASSASPKSGYRISKPGESESPPLPTTNSTSTGNSWLRSIENHHFLTNPQNSSQLPNNRANVSTSSGGNSRLDTRPVLKPSKLSALNLGSSAHDSRAGDCKSFRPISPPLTTSTTHRQFRPASSKTLPTRLNGLALRESNYADFVSKPLPDDSLKWRGRKEFIPPSVLRKNRFLNGLHSSPLNGIHPYTKDKDLRMSAFRQRPTSKDAHSDGSRRRFCRMCGFCLKFALFLSLAFNILLVLLYFYRSPTTQ